MWFSELGICLFSILEESIFSGCNCAAETPATALPLYATARHCAITAALCRGGYARAGFENARRGGGMRPNAHAGFWPLAIGPGLGFWLVFFLVSGFGVVMTYLKDTALGDPGFYEDFLIEPGVTMSRI